MRGHIIDIDVDQKDASNVPLLVVHTSENFIVVVVFSLSLSLSLSPSF